MTDEFLAKSTSLFVQTARFLLGSNCCESELNFSASNETPVLSHTDNSAFPDDPTVSTNDLEFSFNEEQREFSALSVLSTGTVRNAVIPERPFSHSPNKNCEFSAKLAFLLHIKDILLS